MKTVEAVRQLAAMASQHREYAEAVEQVAKALDAYSKAIREIQESVGKLSTDVRYMIFDNECLKRERDEALARLGE